MVDGTTYQGTIGRDVTVGRRAEKAGDGALGGRGANGGHRGLDGSAGLPVLLGVRVASRSLRRVARVVLGRLRGVRSVRRIHAFFLRLGVPSGRTGLLRG